MARLSNLKKLIDIAKTNASPEKEFLADLKWSIETDDKKEKRKPSIFYKPSSMNCIRSMFYARTGKEPDNSSSSYILWGICNSGTDTHERVQTAVSHMKNNGIDCEWINVRKFVEERNLDYLEVISQNENGMETKLRHKTLNLSFMCDGLIKYHNQYFILELKTESSSKWYSRENVDPSHYNQATCYSLSLGIDNVLFVYINRDIFDMKSYIFTVTDDMKQNIVGLIDECDSYVNKLIAPPKPENVPKKACEYCDYKTQCRKDG